MAKLSCVKRLNAHSYCPLWRNELRKQAHHNAVAKRLLTIPGVGEQVASGIVASVPDPSLFKNSRQFAAWLGLVPRQYTTGDNIRLGRITKQGDRYLRICLVHGARAVIANLQDKQYKVSCWARELISRRGYLGAVVAMAAIWTLMVKQEDYKAQPAN
jgi:transposase